LGVSSWTRATGRGCDALQDIHQVIVRIDAVQTAGHDQALQDAVRAGLKPVRI